MPNIKSILFDLDGTLVNSEIFHFNSWNEYLAPSGGKMTWEYYTENLVGIPTSSSAWRVISEFNLKLTENQLVQEIDEFVTEKRTDHEIELMPHALDTVKHFHSLGLPLAVVTGSGREATDHALNNSQLGEYIEFAVTFSDVENSKPHPESYLRASERLGFEKDEYVVFEDTPNGTKAAKAAGLTCYAVQSEVGQHEKLRMADRIFIDLREAREYLTLSID